MNVKKFPKLPKRVKTAYDLLAYVREVILEEPKRYDQSLYVITDATLSGIAGPWEDYIAERGVGAPACGTVACVAGWTASLVLPVGLIGKLGAGSSDRIATRALGLTQAQSDYLFDGGVLGHHLTAKETERLNAKGKIMFDYGTPAYARVGARHIAKFLRKNKAQLQAVKLSESVPAAIELQKQYDERWSSRPSVLAQAGL